MSGRFTAFLERHDKFRAFFFGLAGTFNVAAVPLNPYRTDGFDRSFDRIERAIDAAEHREHQEAARRSREANG